MISWVCYDAMRADSTDTNIHCGGSSRKTRRAGKREDHRETHCGGGDFPSRKAVAAQIRRIALILRHYLPDGAKNVRTIVVVFGSGNVATREEIKL
jgi:hypothetical protein